MTQSANPLNVVLICVDQWRGDALGIAGHPVVRTPYLDRLASQGVRFDRAYAACPSCIAARAGLLTGNSPQRTGRVGYQDAVPWDYPVTIASEFSRGGYQTQAVGKMHVFPERNRLGFDEVTLHDGYLHIARDRRRDVRLYDDYLPWLRQQTGNPHADYFDHGANCNGYVVHPWDREEYLHPTNWVVHQSIDFLYRRDPRRPFFLFMSFHRPHPPYDPPEWAFEQYANATMPELPKGDWVSHFDRFKEPWNPMTQFAGDLPAEVLQRARAGYYGHMSHIDHQIDRFLEALGEFRVAQNTVVCFVSDHGEMMGDHGMFNKCRPYEGSARVPLILHTPASVGVVRGSVRDEPVELRDVMPTLLDAAGLPIPDSIDGKSLLSLARGQAGLWRDYIHGEHTYWGQSSQWLTDGKIKYCWWSGDGYEQLFDLVADPNECRNLAADSSHASVVSEWRDRLIRELTGREEGFTDGKSLLTGRPVKPILSSVIKT